MRRRVAAPAARYDQGEARGGGDGASVGQRSRHRRHRRVRGRCRGPRAARSLPSARSACRRIRRPARPELRDERHAAHPRAREDASCLARGRRRALRARPRLRRASGPAPPRRARPDPPVVGAEGERPPPGDRSALPVGSAGVRIARRRRGALRRPRRRLCRPLAGEDARRGYDRPGSRRCAVSGHAPERDRARTAGSRPSAVGDRSRPRRARAPIGGGEVGEVRTEGAVRRQPWVPRPATWRPERLHLPRMRWRAVGVGGGQHAPLPLPSGPPVLGRQPSLGAI